MSSLTLIGAHRAVSELLENRPESWGVVRFKGLFERLDRRNIDLTYEMLSLRSTGEVVRRADMGGRQEPDEASLPKYLVAEIDDLVVNPMWLIGGGIGVSRRAGAVSPDYRVFRSRGALLPRFVHHLLRSQPYLDQYLLYTRAQTTFDRRVQQPDLNNLPLPVPPLEEQRAIADYLDRETARIDTLIEEQQQLIEMLRERRLAMITESVVGASTANRVLGDSTWYPSLPVGWGRGRVKSIATRVTDGAHISPDTDGGVFDFVSTRDLNGGSIDFDGALKTTPETYEYMVKTGCQPSDGDVLFSKDGTVGETVVVRGGHQFVVASSLVIISPDRERMASNYLAYVFASKTAREQAASMMRGAGLPRLSVGNLARVEVPIPPLGEQHEIAAHLDEQTAKIDRLIAESDLLIKLSKERRSALITAAVTGQIDVRGVVA